MCTIVYIGIGGNLGQRQLFLKATIQRIGEYIGVVKATSSIYETAAWGMDNAPDFLNQVVSVETNLEPLKVLENCLKIERMLGRRRRGSGSGYQSRTADIDLLLYGDVILDHPSLQLPHRGIADRKFVLAPLTEIAPGYLHPVHHQTIATLHDKCSDLTPVKLWLSPTDT